MKLHNGKLLAFETEEPGPEASIRNAFLDIDAACERFWARRGRNRLGGIGEVKKFGWMDLGNTGKKRLKRAMKP
jgi:hypothetical protein